MVPTNPPLESCPVEVLKVTLEFTTLIFSITPFLSFKAATIPALAAPLYVQLTLSKVIFLIVPLFVPNKPTIYHLIIEVINFIYLVLINFCLKIDKY